MLSTGTSGIFYRIFRSYSAPTARFRVKKKTGFYHFWSCTVRDSESSSNGFQRIIAEMMDLERNNWNFFQNFETLRKEFLMTVSPKRRKQNSLATQECILLPCSSFPPFHIANARIYLETVGTWIGLGWIVRTIHRFWWMTQNEFLGRIFALFVVLCKIFSENEKLTVVWRVTVSLMPSLKQCGHREVLSEGPMSFSTEYLLFTTF